MRQRHDVGLIALRTFAILVGVLQGVANRFTCYTEDGIAYLDHADFIRVGDWANGLSAYWSPEYPVVLAGALAVFNPSPYLEFGVAKIVNFAHFVLMLVCFEFMLRPILRLHAKRLEELSAARAEQKTGEPTSEASSKASNQNQQPSTEWMPSVRGIQLFLYASFICLNLSWGGVYQDTPDQAMTAFLFASTGFLLRFIYETQKLKDLVLMSVSLALAYFCKAVALPVAFAYFLIVLFNAPSWKVGFQRAVMAGSIVLLIVAPYVAAISHKVGRFTFSDAGKFNYANAVCRSIPFVQPLAGDKLWPGCHHLVHPSRVIFEHPQVFEFATPLPGTFPMWFEPWYWYEGAEIVFSGLGQFVATVASFSVVFRLFLGQLLLTWIVLAICARQSGLSTRLFFRNMPILLPGIVGMAIYVFGHNVNMVKLSRYFPGYFTLFLAGTALSLKLKNTDRARSAFKVAAYLGVFLFAIPLAIQTFEDVKLLVAGPPATSFNIAQDLHGLGIKEHDYVASVDPTREYWWSRVARTKIVVEIPDIDGLFENYPKTMDNVFAVLKQHGVKAVILLPARYEKVVEGDARWKRLANSDRFVHVIE